MTTPSTRTTRCVQTCCMGAHSRPTARAAPQDYRVLIRACAPSRHVLQILPSQQLSRSAHHAKRNCERGGARLSALYPALFRGSDASSAEGSEAIPVHDPSEAAATPSANKFLTPCAVLPGGGNSGNMLGYCQQRVEPSVYRPMPRTPELLRVARCTSAPAATFAPEHHHAVAVRRDPLAPRPTLDLDDEEDDEAVAAAPGQAPPRRRVVSRRLHECGADLA